MYKNEVKLEAFKVTFFYVWVCFSLKHKQKWGWGLERRSKSCSKGESICNMQAWNPGTLLKFAS